HVLGNGAAGSILQSSEPRHCRLIERVQWPALEHERRDVSRQCFHLPCSAPFGVRARKFWSSKMLRICDANLFEGGVIAAPVKKRDKHVEVFVSDTCAALRRAHRWETPATRGRNV